MKYEKYKSSGVEWIGDIPEHWEVKRIKYILKNPLKYGANEPAVDDDRNNPRYIRITDFGENEILRDDTFKSVKYEIAKNYLLKKGDILFARSGATVGKSFQFKNYNGLACYAGYLIKATPNAKIVISDFLSYYTKSISYDEWKENIFIQATIQNISAEKYDRLELPIPPLSEQTAIAQYLDAKTQAIDKKINLLTKKSETYKELRKSIINDAVCKGLGKNVKLQESEFAFPVNANWKRYRLKDLGYLYSGLSGKAGDDFNQDENPKNKGFIPFTNIANNIYLKANHLGTVVVYDNEKQNKVRKGDIFFLMSSEGYEDIGKTAALAEDIPDTYLNSFCKGYRITKKFCEPYFLNYLLLSDNYRKSLITEGKGFTRINLKMEKVTDFFVYLPPTKEEQTAIANYLDEKTQKIDAIVSNIGKQIDTLKELRKTLINDVVTGKIKVSEL
jgi:type I restriction enzyme S subunit